MFGCATLPVDRVLAVAFPLEGSAGNLNKQCVSIAESSAQTPCYPRLLKIVRRHLHFHAVACCDSDPSLAHFPADGCQHHVLVRQLDPEHRAREHNSYYAFDFNVFFFCFSHSFILKTPAKPRFQQKKSEARF
jgi:hypothetical protein